MIQFSVQPISQRQGLSASPVSHRTCGLSPSVGSKDSVHFGATPGKFLNIFKTENSRIATGLVLRKVIPFISRISFFAPPIGTCIAILAMPVVMFCDWLGEKILKDSEHDKLTGVWVPTKKLEEQLQNPHLLQEGELIQTTNHLLDEVQKTRLGSSSKGLVKDFLQWLRPTEQNFIGKSLNRYTKFRVNIHKMIADIKIPKALAADTVAGKVTRGLGERLLAPAGRFLKRAVVGAPLPLRLLGLGLIPILFKSFHHAHGTPDPKNPPEPKK